MSQVPASGGDFCYNNTREKKNFCPMKTLTKILLGILAYKFVSNDIRRPYVQSTTIGTRTNMAAKPIENNGGL